MNFRIAGRLRPALAGVLLTVLLLTACSEQESGQPEQRPVPVTATSAELRHVQHTEISMGRLNADDAPGVAAETSGRLVRIHADEGDSVVRDQLLAELDAETQRLVVNSVRAEITRIEALARNQQVRVGRLRRLAERQSVSQDQLDEAETQLESLAAQLEEARARLEDAEFNLSRTRIVSPVDGDIQRRHVSVGDFVSPGRVLFELVAPGLLRATLPLPEHLQDRLEVGQKVYLSLPAGPDRQVETRISDIRPKVGEGSRAVELIVQLDNPGGWRPGGSVIGRVVLDERDSVVVPAASVIRRPAGRVVFVVDGNRVRERRVTTGIQNEFGIEIIEGLQAGEMVAVDGAGFLSDDAAVEVQEN